MNEKLIPQVDYYEEGGLMVFTKQFHLKQKVCCGFGCRHCPYNYICVPEPKRSELILQKRVFNDVILSTGNNSSLSKTHSDNINARNPKEEYSFFENVYDVVRQVPKGRVTTYGAIAAYLGTGQSARMVGWAMNASFNIIPSVPAQRVVNRNGMLSGKAHFATPTLMQELLEKEGIKVVNDTIVDFEKLFWDPMKELQL